VIPRRSIAALAAWIVAAAAASAPEPASRAARGTGGAVAAEEGTAARVGVEILRRGGTATDAAVAVAFALAVTWPEAGNIGGGGFWISRDAATGRLLTIDFRERAPRAARRDMFLRPANGGPAPSSTDGPLASGVPGTVAGLALAHRRGGRLPWRDVVAPAVRLARDGFAVTENVRDSIATHKDRLAADPGASAIFLPGGAPPRVGAALKQPDLARTLEAIRNRGEDGFYRGELARRIEEDQKRAGGLVTRGELALYSARVRPAVTFRFGKSEVFTTAAPSSGLVLAEIARIAEAVGLEKLAAGGATGAHFLAEIEKRAFYDRTRFLADPDFPGVRSDLLGSEERIRRLAATIDPRRATPVAALRALESKEGSTTHFSVVDAAGNLVAVTTTLNDSFGNGRVARGLGFLWNDEMDDFTTRPGEPNAFGVVAGEVNAIAPGKRMLSAMCPAIALVPGRGAFALGSPGGSTIPTTVFQVLFGLAVRGESLEKAIEAPRFHQQDYPDLVEIERGRFDPSFVAALEEMGHAVKVSTRDPIPGRIGRVHAAAALPGGIRVAVADSRRKGEAVVVRPGPPREAARKRP
jgi:gamma-glutamyltranspeptidase / glutathione hydrolase